MNQKIIDLAVGYIKDLFASNYGGHDFNHTYRVYKTSLEIAKNHKEADKDIISLIALLHDADDHKLTDNKYNENAYAFLNKQDLDKYIVEKVIKGINEISFSENKDKTPTSIEAMIVQDADRLDAMGAIGIARTFAYGGEHHRDLESSIKHFDEKLLLLKDRMNTPEGKAEADKRHKILEDFLEEFKREIKESE